MMRSIWYDGIMGLVTGDALGCPAEFCTREELRERGGVTAMEGYGTYQMPPGTWTDDSSMALATLDSLRNRQAVVPKDIMDCFAAWKAQGRYTPFGKAFDIGRTCSEAIEAYQKSGDWHTCGRTDEHANGNGALMRILPVCLFLIRQEQRKEMDEEQALQTVQQVTALTHGHRRAGIASGLYYFIVRSIVQNREKGSLKELLQAGLDAGFRYYDRNPENQAELGHFDRIRKLDTTENIAEEEIRSSGYVIDTIEAAVWCLLTTDSFRSCLLKAVNLGDDTDTTAAVAGGPAGLYYGGENIPAEWRNALQRREWIEGLIGAMDARDAEL